MYIQDITSPTHLPTYPPTYLPTYLPICLHTYLLTYLSLYPSLHPSTYCVPYCARITYILQHIQPFHGLKMWAPDLWIQLQSCVSMIEISGPMSTSEVSHSVAALLVGKPRLSSPSPGAGAIWQMAKMPSNQSYNMKPGSHIVTLRSVMS